jgi:hypothetical protein
MGTIPHLHLAGRARPSKVETSTAWTEAKPFARCEDSDKLRYRRLDGATGLDHWKRLPARAAMASPTNLTR